jgi:hypothetical protein
MQAYLLVMTIQVPIRSRATGFAKSGQRGTVLLANSAAFEGPGRRGTRLRGCPPQRPRADCSPLMPLRRAPRRPDLAMRVGVRLPQCERINIDSQIPSRRPNPGGSQGQGQSHGHNLPSVCLQLPHRNQLGCRGGIGAWRSGIKEEQPVIDRCGGQPRSYAPVPHRLAKTSARDFLTCECNPASVSASSAGIDPWLQSLQ